MTMTMMIFSHFSWAPFLPASSTGTPLVSQDGRPLWTQSEEIQPNETRIYCTVHRQRHAPLLFVRWLFGLYWMRMIYTLGTTAVHLPTIGVIVARATAAPRRRKCCRPAGGAAAGK